MPPDTPERTALREEVLRDLEQVRAWLRGAGPRDSTLPAFSDAWRTVETCLETSWDAMRSSASEAIVRRVLPNLAAIRLRHLLEFVPLQLSGLYEVQRLARLSTQVVQRDEDSDGSVPAVPDHARIQLTDDDNLNVTDNTYLHAETA